MISQQHDFDCYARTSLKDMRNSCSTSCNHSIYYHRPEIWSSSCRAGAFHTFTGDAWWLKDFDAKKAVRNYRDIPLKSNFKFDSFLSDRSHQYSQGELTKS